LGIFTGIRLTEAQREHRCTSVRSVDDLILDPGWIDSFSDCHSTAPAQYS